jgi:hypothetical protein
MLPPKCCEIDRLTRLFFALDFREREGAHRLALPARAQGAEGLANLAVLECPAHRDQRIQRMLAERRHERDLLFRRGARLR